VKTLLENGQPIKEDASETSNISHPLSLDVENDVNGDNNKSKQNLSPIDRLTFEVNSIALDWKSYHASFSCTCASPFDSSQRKVQNNFVFLVYLSFFFFRLKHNCWRCGENFCQRCIEHGIRLPGLYSNNFAPVCKTCIRQIKNSPFSYERTLSAKSLNRNRTNTVEEKNQNK